MTDLAGTLELHFTYDEEVSGELVQQCPRAVDDARMLAREELERDDGGAAAAGTLVLEAATEQLELLAVPELSDRAVSGRPDTEVAIARGEPVKEWRSIWRS